MGGRLSGPCRRHPGRAEPAVGIALRGKRPVVTSACRHANEARSVLDAT